MQILVFLYDFCMETFLTLLPINMNITFIEKKFEKYIVKTATKNYEIMDTQKSNILSTSSRFVFVLYFYVTAICVFHVGYYNKVEGQLTPGKYV